MNHIFSFLYLAAEKALRSFSDLPFPLPNDMHNESETTTTTITALNIDSDGINNDSTSVIENDESLQRTTPTLNVTEPREIQSGLTPLYLLNQLKRDAQYETIVDDRTSPVTTTEQREFKIAVTVDGQRFLGAGRSKRIAKTKAAQLALEKLFGMCFDKEGMHHLINFR